MIMCRKTFIMTMLLLLWGGMMHAQAVVTVVTTDGEKHATIITETGHVSIGNESVTLYASSDSNATSSYAIEDVAKMLFSTNMSVTKVTDEVRINLYPNPSGDHFTVDGIGHGEQVLAIYSMQGKEVMRTTCHAGDRIDISSLAQGAYLVRIGNNVGKIVKK